jgi:DNA-directed RNA polymerase subunit F
MKKQKEPVCVFWHAFALGMSGNIKECLRELESFQARRDLQYAINVALIYFHKKASQVDKEAISSLKNELSVAEDVTVSSYINSHSIIISNIFSDC